MTRFKLKLPSTLALWVLSSMTAHAADLELIPGRFLQRGEYAEQVFTLKTTRSAILIPSTANAEYSTATS